METFCWRQFFYNYNDGYYNSFLNLLNDIDPNISFTTELEQDNKISFLDTLITRPQVTTSKLMCLGNLLIQTGILTLTHTTTLNTN